jgi:hypothetical protein
MEVSEVRRRLRAAIQQARRDAADRRERSDRAARDYEQLLTERAAPILHTLATALTGEGHPFKVHTPAGSVRLAAEGSSEDYIEITLDSTQDPPAVLLRSSRGRGRRQITSERALAEGEAIASLSDEEVLSAVLAEIGPLVER